VASAEYVTERFRIMRNYTVTRLDCQEIFSFLHESENIRNGVASDTSYEV
jgi:hypothetical protein